MGCYRVCNDGLMSADGRAGGCLKEIIPKHCAASSLQVLMTET